MPNHEWYEAAMLSESALGALLLLPIQLEIPLLLYEHT